MIHRPNIPKIRSIKALQDTLYMQSPIARANEHIQNGRARRVKAADITDAYLQLEQK